MQAGATAVATAGVATLLYMVPSGKLKVLATAGGEAAVPIRGFD
jgi:hypothetical protein